MFATVLIAIPGIVTDVLGSLLITLGLLVLIFGLRSALNLHGAKLVRRLWAVPAGLVGGTISGLFGTGGPPYVIYLNHRIHKPAELRASFTGLFFLECLWRAWVG